MKEKYESLAPAIFKAYVQNDFYGYTIPKREFINTPQTRLSALYSFNLWFLSGF